jgi:hypothetical protein
MFAHMRPCTPTRIHLHTHTHTTQLLTRVDGNSDLIIDQLLNYTLAYEPTHHATNAHNANINQSQYVHDDWVHFQEDHEYVTDDLGRMRVVVKNSVTHLQQAGNSRGKHAREDIIALQQPCLQQSTKICNLTRGLLPLELYLREYTALVDSNKYPYYPTAYLLPCTHSPHVFPQQQNHANSDFSNFSRELKKPHARIVIPDSGSGSDWSTSEFSEQRYFDEVRHILDELRHIYISDETF